MHTAFSLHEDDLSVGTFCTSANELQDFELLVVVELVLARPASTEPFFALSASPLLGDTCPSRDNTVAGAAVYTSHRNRSNSVDVCARTDGISGIEHSPNIEHSRVNGNNCICHTFRKKHLLHVGLQAHGPRVLQQQFVCLCLCQTQHIK
jgi:hypothetical protein